MREQLAEYFVFDGKIVFLQGLWELISPSTDLEFSSWEMIFYSFLMSFVFKKFHKKEWGQNFKNAGFITIPLLLFLSLILLAPNQIKDDRSYYNDVIAEAKSMDIDYREWRDKNPRATLNPEWTKDRDFLSRERTRTSNEIIIKLSNQIFFLLFFALGFFYKKHTIRNVFYKLKSEYQTISRKINKKKEQEKNRIESEKMRAENERRAKEQRLLKEEQQQKKTEKETVINERTIQDNSSSEINELIERANRSQR